MRMQGEGLVTTMTPINWQKARNILCIRLDSMGDVLMTSPAIRALKLARRGRRITLLTSPSGASVAKLIPEIDEVIEYEAPWMKSTPDRYDSMHDQRMVELLKQREFDAVVIFTVFSQSPLPAAFLAYLANIPLRLACCRENPYQLLTDWVPETEPDGFPRHEVRRQLDLVGAIGCGLEDERLSVHVPGPIRKSVEMKLTGCLPAQPMPWIAVHPGASAPSRRYAPEGFAAVVEGMYTRYGLLSVLTGSQAEVPLVENIQEKSGVPSVSLAGMLTVGELAGLLERATLLISNNTGPAHLAAAVGTPVVDLYALTNPQHTPWGVPNRVLFHDVGCKFCYKSMCPEGHHNCLGLVKPETVIAAVCDLLQEVSHREGTEQSVPDQEMVLSGNSLLNQKGGKQNVYTWDKRSIS